MRVTGGSARGRRLKSPGAGARPTSDRVREALFDVLEARGVSFTSVLDLYAGSGALGIEAISRGAERCDFVERDAGNLSIIKENLRALGLEREGKVHRVDASRAASRLRGPYALVLADPPYGEPSAVASLAELAQGPLLSPGGVIVLEHSSRRTAPEAIGPLPLAWTRRYGDTQVSIYEDVERER